MPLPDESPEDYADETDLIADARDAILEGRLTTEGEPSASPDDVPDNFLPSPLTRAEILEEQAADEYCQSLFNTQVGQKGSWFFEDEDGILCRIYPREQDLVQIVLPVSLRLRAL